VWAAAPAASNLTHAIEALRLADERFYRVRVEVRGDVVYLAGTVNSWEHLFELARSVSRLPGVRQVRFGEVRAETPSNAR
jgi:osmotically-inducible protein OsmY